MPDRDQNEWAIGSLGRRPGTSEKGCYVNRAFSRLVPALKSIFIAAAASLFLAAQSDACTTTWNITLETFGEGVTVELRFGIPGNSTVVGSRASSGGQVQFGSLCAGSYFLAIGNDDSVSVTPVRDFRDNGTYSSR